MVVLGVLAVLTAGCSTVEPDTGGPPAPRWPVLSYAPSLILHHKELSSTVGATADGSATRTPRITNLPKPRIVSARRKLQCVPYARAKSKIGIRGHSWHWWRAAAGKYRRGKRPRPSAVLVFKRNRGSRGHLATVTQVVDNREIIVSHANWLNKGKIHLNTPILDVSANNDWSLVQVWYTPGNRYGSSRYRIHGFIYPGIQTASR